MELFNAKFSEALKTVGKQMEFEQLYMERENFRDRIIAVVGKDLNGYVLEDAAIDYLEQTPMNVLDPDNILDAQGIRKITQLTAEQHVQTNIAEREEEMRIKQKDVQARWYKKQGKNHYGFKSPISIDNKHKMIRHYAVTSGRKLPIVTRSGNRHCQKPTTAAKSTAREPVSGL